MLSGLSEDTELLEQVWREGMPVCVCVCVCVPYVPSV